MSTLRNAILGGWELASFEARDADTGTVTHPLGSAPRGLILYTGDGYMSAQLTGSADAAVPDETLPDETLPDETLPAYSRFHFDEDTATVHHEVTVSMMPELLTGPQVRHVALDGDRLSLSATTTNDGVTQHNTLTWQRASAAALS